MSASSRPARIAFSYLGLSLDRPTIVAGALSVGIGFGLQSIVNNFVSGLILLWERPIRVGDLVVVGDGEGYVRRINVRATEIETFDRSTVIVPNSNLISGVVRNRVRNDRIGRVLVSVPVPRASDPDQVAEIMRTAALAHREVMSEPAPRVLLQEDDGEHHRVRSRLLRGRDRFGAAASRATSISRSSAACGKAGIGVPARRRRAPEPDDEEHGRRCRRRKDGMRTRALTLLKDKSPA